MFGLGAAATRVVAPLRVFYFTVFSFSDLEPGGLEKEVGAASRKQRGAPAW